MFLIHQCRVFGNDNCVAGAPGSRRNIFNGPILRIDLRQNAKIIQAVQARSVLDLCKQTNRCEMVVATRFKHAQDLHYVPSTSCCSSSFCVPKSTFSSSRSWLSSLASFASSSNNASSTVASPTSWLSPSAASWLTLSSASFRQRRRRFRFPSSSAETRHMAP
jgi:hypothetical protein